MKNILKKRGKGKALAIVQAFSIILSTIAFAYILASSFPVVSAADGQCIRADNYEWLISNNGNSVRRIDQTTTQSVSSFCLSHLFSCIGTRLDSSQIHDCPTTTTTTPQSTSSIYLKVTGLASGACRSATRLGINVPQGMNAAQYCISSSVPSGAFYCGSDSTCDTGNLLPASAAQVTAGAPPVAVNPTAVAQAAAAVVPKVGASTVPEEAIKAGAERGAAGGIGLRGVFRTAIYGKITIGNLITTAAKAALIYAGTRFVLSQLHFVSPEFAAAASNAVTTYYFVTQIVGRTGITNLLGLGSLTIPVIGIIAAVIVFFITFSDTRYDRYQFTCYPWDAPLRGRDCEKCNQGDLPCTEYRCKSLGQACQLENPETGEELCIWQNRNDVNPPVIQPWEKVLTTGYKYNPDNTISPPNRGVKIVPKDNNTGCVAAFTPLKFGVTLDEPGKCKLATSNKASFDDPEFFFFGGSSTTKYNHSQTMSLPSIEALAAQNATLENGGEFTLYAKCQDANGNSNTGNFVFKFCVDQGPDTTTPLIVTTSIINGMPIPFNTSSVPLDVYVNEPADCKWSKIDQSYQNMENNMSCNRNVFEFNAQGLYKCSTTLTGLNDGVDNNFYFRCKDQPYLVGTANESQRNANPTSCIFAEDEKRCKFTLKGTRALVIDSVKPNGTIKDSTDVIKVTLEATTSAGFHQGDSLCSYNGTGTNNKFIQFLNTGSNEHSQDLFLPEGTYSYDIKCVDLGGNADTETTSFVVETDTEAPIVVRAFNEGGNLNIVTNEEATCVYSTTTATGCNYLFEDGVSMQSLEKNRHQTSWESGTTFYIKCEDEFGNQPLPNECSITVRPYS